MRGHGPRGQLREVPTGGSAVGPGWSRTGSGSQGCRESCDQWVVEAERILIALSANMRSRNLSKEQEKKAEAIFPRKTKVVQERKLIIVHYVPYLRTVFT